MIKRSEFEAWTETPEGEMNPELWEKKFDSMLTGFSPLPNNSPISNRGKADLALEQSGVQTLYRQNLVTASNRAIFKNANLVTLMQADTAYDAGEQKVGDAFIDGATGTYIHDWEASGIKQMGAFKVEARRKRLLIEEEKAENDLHMSFASHDPWGWQEANPTPWEGKEMLWQKVKNHSDARKNEIVTGLADDVLNGVYSGQITVPGQIDALVGPGATPRLKEELKKNLATFDKAKADAEKRANGDVNFVREYVAAQQLNFKGMDDEKRAIAYSEALNRVLSTVPDDGRQGAVRQELARKFNARPSEGLKLPSESQKMINDRFDMVWKTGGFGRLRRWDDALQEDVDDPVKISAALVRRAEAQREMRLWMENNPQATPKEIDSKMGQVLDGAVSDNAAQTMGVSVDLSGNWDWQKYLRENPAVTQVAGAAPQLAFGGQQVPKSGEIGEAKPTVFGGVNDPVDNGLSAFGGKTGAGGREGVAVPEKILRHVYGNDREVWKKAKVEVTTEDGSQHILDIADLGTAEWVWDRAGMPVIDLTEGAVEKLGGEVVYTKSGKLKGTRGLGKLKVRLLKPGELGWDDDIQAPPFSN